MSYQFWHSCYRISGVVFPASTLGLFFTPIGSGPSAVLGLTAVASTGLWAYCMGHPPKPDSTD